MLSLINNNNLKKLIIRKKVNNSYNYLIILHVTIIYNYNYIADQVIK